MYIIVVVGIVLAAGAVLYNFINISTIVACGIALILGVVLCNLINIKFTTDENVGRFIGLAFAIILIAFFFSDSGQIFLRKLIQVFPVNLRKF